MSNVRRGSAVLAVVAGAAFFFSVAWKPAPPAKAIGLVSSDVPVTVAGYTSSGDQQTSDYIKAALPGADIISRNYSTGNAGIDFLLISGAHGVALHDPRLCMGSLLLSAPQTERLAGTPVAMQVYHASSRPATPPDMLVAYFYVANGRIISSPSQIRASLFWGDLLGRQNSPVYFFRFVQPLTPDADARLQTFATQMWRNLGPKIEAITHEKVAVT